MESLKLKIKLQSSFKTKFQSDTIFGQFCWMYRYIFGNDKLEIFLSNFKNEPAIAFSDGFFGDLLPKPLLEPLNFSDDELKKAKDYKKLEFVEKDIILQNRHNLSDRYIFNDFVSKNTGVNDNYATDRDEAKGKDTYILKNSIDRISGTAKAGLYVSKETFFSEDARFTLYVKYKSADISRKEILQVMQTMGEFGFGRDASTGNGKFKIIEDEILDNPKELSFFEGANSFMALSHGIPKEDADGLSDCRLNYGKIITKFPKHGGFLGLTDNYFKNPFVVYRPGSTFIFNGNPKDVYGRVLDNVSFTKGTIQGVLLLPLFLKI